MADRIKVASSEAELDAIEQPVRTAFADFMRDIGLRGTETTVLALTFRTGGLHFAAKALEFVPPHIQVIIAGTSLSREEIDFLKAMNRPVFNSTSRYDNELVYEMLMENTAGSFGWVDADCFVLDPAIWDRLVAPMRPDVTAHTAFTYDPLGFAKSVLVVFDRKARDLLDAEGTTLNSYALEPTNVGRAAPHAISRVLQDRHLRALRQVMGVEPDGELKPHDGFLDIFENGRTVNTRKRAQTTQWFGDDVGRRGWLIDTPMMAEVTLRAHGFKTHRLIDSNREVTQDIIHVGASSYRDRMREEGATTDYLARFKLTDLFEVLLADALAGQGVGGAYRQLADAQRRRLMEEAGISGDDVKQAARSRLEEHDIDVARLAEDPRFGFLF